MESRIEGQKYKQTDIWMDRQTDRQVDGKTDGKADRQIEWQIIFQMDRRNGRRDVWPDIPTIRLQDKQIAMP